MTPMPCLVQLFKPSSTHQALVSGDEDVMLTYSTDPHTDLPHCLDTAWPAQVDSPLSHPTLILSLWQLPINNIINISSLSCCVHVMCGHVIHTHTSPQCHVWSCDSHTHTPPPSNVMCGHVTHTPDFFPVFSLWHGRANRDRLSLVAWQSDWDRVKFSVTVFTADDGEVLSDWLLLSDNEVNCNWLSSSGNGVISDWLWICDTEVTWLAEDTGASSWDRHVEDGDTAGDELSLSSLVVLTLLGGVSSSLMVSISPFPVSVSSFTPLCNHVTSSQFYNFILTHIHLLQHKL